MSLLFTNNAVSTLAAGIGPTDTSLSVQATDGNLFPNPTGNDEFLCTLQDASNNIEIVRVTARAGDAFTIVRAQDNTTALTWLAGDSVELRITAEVLSTYRQGVGAGVQTTAINKVLGLADRHDFIECTAGVTVTLPDAATVGEGYQITIKNNDFSVEADVTIDKATGSDTINGQLISNITLPYGDSIYLSTNATLDGWVTFFQDNRAELLDAVYPVGSVYQSTESTDPATLFGGSWTAIGGRFLVGVGTASGKTYVVSETGGQADGWLLNHNHSYTQNPHVHGISPSVNAASGNTDSRDGSNDGTAVTQTQGANADITITGASLGGYSNNGSLENNGNNLNLPPYYAVYMWRRTG